MKKAHSHCTLLPWNVVGYVTTDSISAGQYKALGTVFTNLDGTDIAVKDLITVTTPASGANMGASDQIWIWDTASSSWTKYYSRKARGMTTALWVKEGTETETTDTVAAGTTFFFTRPGGSAATTLTVSGSVKELTGSSSFTVSAGQLAFASNPWPVSIKVSDITKYYAAGAMASGANIGVSDQIWRWNTATSTWTKYYSRKARGMTSALWVKDGEETETTDEINAGEGFFFSRPGGTAAVTVTFTK